MHIERTETLLISTESHVVEARQLVRRWSVELSFGLTDQTKMVTAASEIARNTLIYGGGGQLHLAIVSDSGKRGLQLIFEDKGPGIPDVDRALQDGFTSGRGLGLGLGGSKRLVHEFHIVTGVAQGTKITLLRWK